MSNRFRATSLALIGVFALSLGGSPSAAVAAAAQLDSGVQVSPETPYGQAQMVTDVFSTKAVYGKLEGDTPVDIYKFTPDRDGEQTISLLGLRDEETLSALTGILIDPTDATEASGVAIPLPDSSYHATVMDSPEPGATSWEPLLGIRYDVIAQERIALQKDKTYYVVVLDRQAVGTRYAVKFGEGQVWAAGEVVQALPTWFRILSDSYAGSSPFTFGATTFSFLLFMLGLMLLTGLFIIEQSWALMANKFKSAGYLLVRLQPFSRIMNWIALWLTALGGYLYFDRVGWLGIPVVLLFLFIPLTIALLYQTFRLSPRVAQLEVTKREAVIPFGLRKRWFFSFLVSFFSLSALIAYLVVYLVKQ